MMAINLASTFATGTVLFFASLYSTYAAPSLPAYQKLLNGVVEELPEKLDQAELLEPPHLNFVSVPEDREVGAGSGALLECEVEGIPPPIIRWKFNGQDIELGKYQNDDNTVEKLLNLGLTTIENGVTKSRLLIDCASESDAGVYACVADNGHTEIEATASLKVTETNKLDVSCLSKKAEGRGPQIYMWTDGRFEREGATAQLYCRARGSPEPKIFWTNSDGNLIQDDSTYTNLPNGDLLIKDADWDSMDSYECIAHNSHGQDRASAFFYPTKGED